MRARTAGRVLWRGVRRRCPVCGQGRLFRRWFVMVERCPRCHLRFERAEGHWLGAIGIGTILVFGLLFAVLAIGFVATYPDPPVATLTALGLIIAVGVPLLLFPVTRTLWTAIDILMRPLEPEEVRPEYRIIDRRTPQRGDRGR